ncbi:MAG: hypothetical protein IPJ32_19865 [Sphingobacteriaceae bacterium]|nr:hypothetical protein [Sphingobacteriaceae bacterium]
MGMAIMYLPFFAVAHLSANLFGYETDGFSEPYQMMIQFSGLVYLVIGLFFLRKLLLLYYSEKVTAITLFCVLFGSNLFYYASVHGAMSHTHTFCLLFLVFFGITNLVGLKHRLFLFLRHIKFVFLMIALATLVFLPQMLYWKHITGHYFFNSYVGEQFYFGNPHLLEGLFGFRKGWLLYSPIMIFSLIGMFMLFKNRKEFSCLSLFYFDLYLCDFILVVLVVWRCLRIKSHD